MELSKKLKEYYNNPFGFVDKLNLTFIGNNLNIFQKFHRVRCVAFSLAIVCFGCWMIFGFDSTPLQFVHVLYEGIPNFLFGKASFNDLVNIYNRYYGCEMHYSAFVIYGLMFWALSRHFDKKLGITGSRNIAYTCSLTFLSIAIFEVFWLYSFAIFQNQSWVITLNMPQLQIHLKNILFLTVGFLGVLYMWSDSHVFNDKKQFVKRLFTFRWNKKAFLLIGLSVAAVLFWIYYPFYVETISVPLENGEVWTNSNLFPQTLYTIDLNPSDNVNVGAWFFVENNLIHGINTLVKIVWTFTIGYVGLIRKVKENG